MGKYTIFVDMDGVVSNFVQGALEVHGFHYEDVLSAWPAGEFSIPKVVGLSTSEFWKGITQGVWENLNPYDEAKTLVTGLQGHFGFENVFFLSSPTIDPGCLAGKGAWIQEHFPDMWYKRMFVFTPHKHLFAKRKTILIDDYDKNCAEFAQAGGWTVCYPQPWNRMHNYEGGKVGHVNEEIQNIIGRREDD